MLGELGVGSRRVRHRCHGPRLRADVMRPDRHTWTSGQLPSNVREIRSRMGSREHGSLPGAASQVAQTPPAEHESGVRAHYRYDARHTHRRGAPRRARCRRRPDGGVGAFRGPGRPRAHLPRLDRARPARPPGDGAPLGDRGRARRRPGHRRRRRDRGRGAGSRRPGRLAARRRPTPRERAGVGPRRPRRDDLPQGGPTGPAFWARRQCHETTVHALDARSALEARHLTAADVWLTEALASRRGRRAARRVLAAPHEGPPQRIPLHRSRFGDRWPGVVARRSDPTPR